MRTLTSLLSRYCLCLLLLICACREKQPAEKTTDEPGAMTPVTVVSADKSPLAEFVELNAVSTFLQKSYLKANANGYLESVHAYSGQSVSPGMVLFTLKTKEAQSIGNSITALDSTFKFSGLISIRANGRGYITQLNHQQGDYVQDGEQLAVISDRNSFVFLLDVPYEMRSLVPVQKMVELILPDGRKLDGRISSIMPVVDATSQTQNIVIRINSAETIPENLIAKVRIRKTEKDNTQSFPRAAVLTNETQSEFWVMKMTDSTTAVKVPVSKGLETAERVEIVSPIFADSDRILVTGNYGLPDTAKVKIVH